MRRTVYRGPDRWRANQARKFYSTVDYTLPYEMGAAHLRWFMAEEDGVFVVWGEL